MGELLSTRRYTNVLFTYLLAKLSGIGYCIMKARSVVFSVKSMLINHVTVMRHANLCSA